MTKSITRSESATHTFRITYGSKGNFELKYSRIKKGAGKGKLRAKVFYRKGNTFENLTWNKGR